MQYSIHTHRLYFIPLPLRGISQGGEKTAGTSLITLKQRVFFPPILGKYKRGKYLRTKSPSGGSGGKQKGELMC